MHGRSASARRSSRSSVLIFIVFVMLLMLGGRHGAASSARSRCIQLRQRLRTWSAPKGLLQPFADVIKLMFKEELRPAAADALLFALAPIISATAAFAAFAVVPFGAETTLFGLLDEPMPLQVADVNVAVLVIFAIASMGVYGIVLAGWSSNSKYSLLGGLRSSAQMISYELSYGWRWPRCSCWPARCRCATIVNEPVRATGGLIPKWYVFLQPIGFLIFMTAASPRPTARRSTFRKPSRSWSPATTPNTAA